MHPKLSDFKRIVWRNVHAAVGHDHGRLRAAPAVAGRCDPEVTRSHGQTFWTMPGAGSRSIVNAIDFDEIRNPMR